MKIIKSTDNRKASERWKSQYYRNNGWGTVWVNNISEPTEDIYNKLVKAETKANPDYLDQIDTIIGNKGWTHNSCYQCGLETRDPMIQLDINDGEYIHNLCISCVRKALNLLEQAK